MDLCYLSATDAIEMFRNRKLSPVELMQAIIDRAEQVEPRVNAICFQFFDEALAAAETAEQRYMNQTARPLEGIPLAVKDESEIEGQPTTYGSLLEKDHIAERTSIINQRLLDAGAIVHARTTTPEFCISATTSTKLWGTTHNPWNPAVTCGGSSGGSGASLASGTTTLATGSDIGGSIRIPASLNGLVGFKPPYGRVPEEPPFNLEYYNHSGPLTRIVMDCILMQNVISGPHPWDIASIPEKVLIPTDHKKIDGMRIAYSYDLGYQELDPEIRRNTASALRVFRDLGAVVEEVDLNWTWQTAKSAIDHLSYATMGAWIQDYYEKDKEQLTGYVREFAEKTRRVTIKEALEADMVAGEMWIQMSEVFKTYDLFVCPTIAHTGVNADLDYSRDTVEINGVSVDPMLGWVMTYPFNILSRCPVLTVPSGKASNNVPTGIQLVGNRYDDLRVFQAAVAYEREFGSLFREKDYPLQ